MNERIGYGTYVRLTGFTLIAFLFTWVFDAGDEGTVSPKPNCNPAPSPFSLPGGSCVEILIMEQGKSLEEMDAVFGDATAAEEKTRLYAIATSLGLEGAQVAARDIEDGRALHAEAMEV
ncbi:hypothetical protein PMIN04_005744 [Paraphaeosphaeria minitans]